MRTHRTRWLFGGGLAAIALALALTSGVVFADSPSNAADDGATLRDLFKSHLATDLNLSEDQLTATVKQAADEAIDDSAAQGDLTQEQADALKAKVDAGEWGAIARAGLRHHRRQEAKQDVFADIANQLGMTPQALRDEVAAGTPLSQIISEHGKTVDQVVDDVVNDAQTRFDARESTLLDRLRDCLTNAINGNGMPSDDAQSATPTS